MHTGQGQIIELILEDGSRLVRISCPPKLIPAPGQYLLAGEASEASGGLDSALPVPVFYTDSTPDGFIAAPLEATSWRPGQELHLRGPLGRGFELPNTARYVALVVFDDGPALLRGLIKAALRQGAAVVLVCDLPAAEVPDEVEVQPLSALLDVVHWADYLALDVARANLQELGKRLSPLKQVPALRQAQILVRTQMPCGGIADCGVCAVNIQSGWKLACKLGPVLAWPELG